ncbi:MAG: helix-turn-helix domain-containing protein [Acidimicrobiales bacterium]
MGARARGAEVRWLGEREQEAWRGLLRMHAELGARLSRNLQQASGLSLADYDVLVHLAEADDGRLRVFELARSLRWEKSRVSHQVTRMERRDLVVREDCDTDARGAFARLTTTGRRALRAAAAGHVEDVRRYLIDVVSQDQLDALADVSTAVLGALADEG